MTELTLVALARPPANPEQAARLIAAATAAAPVEARMRLQGEAPQIIARLSSEAAAILVSSLAAAGLAALLLPEKEIPTDAQRTVARTLDLAPSAFTLAPRAGPPLAIPWAGLKLLLRGTRAHRSESVEKRTEKQFSLGKAIATQGMSMTSKVTREIHKVEERVEHLLLVYGELPGGSVGRAVIYEDAVAWACLGSAMQPSKLANFHQLTRMLAERAPGARLDDRLLRLGRRPLPLGLAAGGPSRAIDVLGELMWRAAEKGLL